MEIKALTSLRFFLTVAVIAFHFLKTDDLPILLANVVQKGWNTVPFFFALSGFVLTLVYYKTKTNKVNLIPFYTTRFARLYPSYILALVLTVSAFVYFLGRDVNWFGISSYTFLLQPFYSGTLYDSIYNGPAWSVATEFFLYLIFPFALICIKKISKTKTLLLVLILVSAINTIIGILISQYFQKKGWNSTEYEVFKQITHGPLYYLPTFFMGMLSGAIYLNLKKYYHISHGRLYSFIFVGSLMLYLLQLVFNNPFVEANPSFLAIFTLPVLISAGFVSGLIEKLFSHPVLVYLGSISYGMYIFQEPVRWGVEFMLKSIPSIIVAQAAFLKWDWPIFLLYLLILIAFCVIWKPFEVAIYTKVKDNLYKNSR